jgi:hypothetical protein
MKKQYETPKMSSIDFDYAKNLLVGSCDEPDVDTLDNGDLGLNFDKIDNNKA